MIPSKVSTNNLMLIMQNFIKFDVKFKYISLIIHIVMISHII